MNPLQPPINVAISQDYPPPKKIESTCLKALNSWCECDLGNVVSSNKIRHKMKRKRRMKTDSGMKHNLMKRGQIVNQMIGICSDEHGISMKEVTLKLDTIRVNLNKTLTQHWMDWFCSKKDKSTLICLK